jgi:transcriptional regulator with XRE-family HTH domain
MMIVPSYLINPSKKTMNNIGRNAKKMREKAEMSQSQLAEAAEVSIAFISKLEGGKFQTLSLEICKNMADGLSLTLQAFLSGLGFFDEEEKQADTRQMVLQALRRDGLTKQKAQEAYNLIQYVRDKNG